MCERNPARTGPVAGRGTVINHQTHTSLQHPSRWRHGDPSAVSVRGRDSREKEPVRGAMDDRREGYAGRELRAISACAASPYAASAAFRGAPRAGVPRSPARLLPAPVCSGCAGVRRCRWFSRRCRLPLAHIVSAYGDCFSSVLAAASASMCSRISGPLPAARPPTCTAHGIDRRGGTCTLLSVGQ